MAVDVVQTKQHRHVTVYENATCHTRGQVHACVSARVCSCVCINNEIPPFLGFFLSHYVHMMNPDRKNIENTRSRVKTITKLTNLRKLTRIEGYSSE